MTGYPSRTYVPHMILCSPRFGLVVVKRPMEVVENRGIAANVQEDLEFTLW